MSFWIAILLVFVVGLITGIWFTCQLIRWGIAKADITSDDRRFVRDVLGISE